MTRPRDARELFRNHDQSGSHTSVENLIPVPASQTRSSTASNKKSVQLSVDEDLSKLEHPPQPSSLVDKCRIFMPLIPTTIISSLLLAGNLYRWTVPRNIYDIIVVNRGSTQLVVQIVASSLGLLHITVLCLLINYTTRLRLAKAPTSLDTLQLWNDLLSQRIDWSLPARYLTLLLIFLGLCTIPAALWAAAITPLSVTALRSGVIALPSYSNLTLLQQNHTDRSGLASVSNKKGMFTYSPGEAYLGSLLSSASTATPIDNSIRQHAKFDFSRFNYHGRSFGVGASVGLVDDELLSDPLATQYTFQETGYWPIVACSYNASSAFSLKDFNWTTPDLTKVFIASGYLPNSNGQQEWARYPSFNTNAIFAIGAATNTSVVGRMIAIAAGAQYASLNSTQCNIDFQSAIYNVTVDLDNRNITVKLAGHENSDTKYDIEPSGLLTFLTTWQFYLMASDQTSLYSSLIGNSIKASINNYVINSNNFQIKPEDAALGGLQNSITAMTDDLLTCYASAQLMVANNTTPSPVAITIKALQFGERKYIILVVVLNTLLILLVLEEAIRTGVWAFLTDFDYMNPRNLLVGSSRGGRELAEVVDTVRANDQDLRYLAGEKDVGRLRVVQKGTSITLASGIAT